jgi:hypothetical protein
MLEAIDWRRPWLAPLRHRAEGLLAAPDWRAACNDAAAQADLRNHRGLPITFVAQSELLAGVPYETHISNTGQVPTRANLHDFFNALIWLAQPLSKARLNAIQAAEIVAHSQPATAGSALPVRGKVRDRATIFDENAAVLLSADPDIAAALRAHRWHDVLLQQRDAFGQRCELHLFGHALLEKLVAPYKAITAHVWILPVAVDHFGLSPAQRHAALDAQLALALAGGLLQQPSTPLPVLGVPHWWAEQDAGFYADITVFRPPRKT